MSVPPPAGSRGGLIADLVGRVLDFMSAPWKAATVIVLLILSGLGYGAWVERDRLFFRPRTTAAALDLPKLPAEVTELLHQTGADIVMVWSVELAGNAQYFQIARTKSGAPWSFTPRRLPAVLSDTSGHRLTATLHGGFCADPATLPSLLAQRLAADGFHRTCAVAIRGPINVLGVIYLAWRNPPALGLETAALADAGDTAAHLVR